MTYADFTGRAALIGGLRALADYLESNPEVPAPVYPVLHTFPAAGDWATMRTEIDVIAERIGAAARETGGGHYVATRSFGPVRYTAVAIPRSHNDESE